jgi:hypothetical protein
MRRISLWPGVALAVCSLAAPVRAQDTGSITGTVTDTSGAVIAGAEIAITNPATGVTRTAATNAQGDYLVAGLTAGRYNLTIATAGFQKYEADGIILRVAENARADAGFAWGRPAAK